MAAANNEFFEALSMLEHERGITAEYLIEKIKAAIVIAVKKNYEVEDDNVLVEIDPAGRRALVVGGGMVGCEAAEYLAERGHQVAIVEMKDVIAADVTPENRRYMFRNFGENHVLLQPGAKAPGNAVLATGDALEAALAI